MICVSRAGVTCPSRANYATGALRAARFIMSQPNGLYDMADVLGFK